MLPRTCLFPLWIPRLLYFSHNNSSSMSVTAILVARWNTELVLPAWRDTTDHPATTPVLYQYYILLSVHYCLCRNIISYILLYHSSLKLSQLLDKFWYIASGHGGNRFYSIYQYISPRNQSWIQKGLDYQQDPEVGFYGLWKHFKCVQIIPVCVNARTVSVQYISERLISS
jgi:hypothetical protein